MKIITCLLSFVCFVAPVRATIHYVWSVSDQIGNGAFAYDLDLNGDNDFSFSETGYEYIVTTLTINNKFAAEGASGYVPKAYSEGAALGTYHWQNGQGMLMNWSTNSGNFFNVNKYLMVRFMNGTSVHYGWIYLEGSGDYLWVEGYAYSDVPDEIIRAGQTTSVKELEDAAAVIAQLSNRSVAFNDCSAFDYVQVVNSNGQLNSEIRQPQPHVIYPLSEMNGWCVMAFYRENELLFTHRYGLKQ